MRTPGRRAVAMIPFVATLVACGGGPTPAVVPTAGPPSRPAAAGPDTAPPNDDLLADIDVGGGRTMHLLCVGPKEATGPTVIFENGLGGDAGQWSDVIHSLDGEVRACAYDRAGEGQSPAIAVGRTTRDQVADLRALLAAAKVRPPYLLVGYSLGGWNVLVHHADHPDDVVGAVMAEVRPPEASARWLAALPPPASNEPEAVQLARDESTAFDTDPSRNTEGLVLRDSAAQATAAGGFGDKPLVVLAASDDGAISEGFDPIQGKAMTEIWWELQADLAGLSSRGRLEKVDGTDHELPMARPDAVAAAIREVLTQLGS